MQFERLHDSLQVGSHATSPTITAVVPVFNSGIVLQESISCLVRALEGSKRTFEIILVDDASNDNRTPNEIVALTQRYPQVRSEFLERNVGQCFAVLEGFRLAKGAFVGMIDDDLPVNPQNFVTAIELLETDRALECIQGVIDQDSYTRYRLLRSRIVRRLTKMSNAEPPEGFCFSSFRVMTRNLAIRVVEDSPDFPYLQMRLTSLQPHCRYLEVFPDSSKYLTSRYGLAKSMREFARILKVTLLQPIKGKMTNEWGQLTGLHKGAHRNGSRSPNSGRFVARKSPPDQSLS